MILLTGAAGKTGRTVLKALLKRGHEVRILVRRLEQGEQLVADGAAEAVVGDLTGPDSINRALEGIESLYFICPNVHPEETAIGCMLIDAACSKGLSHFVYHSVLHPQVEKMPHHWQKMRVEEMLFESGLDFTILQPAPYMQNLLAGRDLLLREQVFRIPYPPDTELSLVDLHDLAEAAALVLTEPGHKAAIYEIVGTRALTQTAVAGLIGETLGFSVTVEEIRAEEWRKDAEKKGLGPYQIETLLKMFDYYRQHGLHGSNYILGQLLGRPPVSLNTFIRREFA